MEITAQHAVPTATEQPLEEPILLEDEAESPPPPPYEESGPTVIPPHWDDDAAPTLPGLDLSPMSELPGDLSPEPPQEDIGAPSPESVEPAPPKQDSAIAVDEPYHQALALYFLGRFAEAIEAIVSSGTGAAEHDLRRVVLKLSCRRAASQWVELVDDAAHALATHGHEEDPKLYLLYQAALAYEHLGQTEDAVGCYDEIVRVRPDYHDASEHLQRLSPPPEDATLAIESTPPPHRSGDDEKYRH